MSSILNTYARKKISFKKGKGCYLYANDGKKYLDFVQGIAVNSLGHCHSHLIKTINKQSRKLWHVSNAFTILEQEKLAQRLCKHTFADVVAFQNSGTEATELAIKLARKYFYSQGKKNKNKVVTFQGAFHGRTLAALFAANNPKHIEGFGPKVNGFDQVPFADHEALKKAVTNDTAAIMVEPIFGEGGVKVVPDYCIKGIRELCDEKDVLLILDEVQCGVGRTGKFFAFEHTGVIPDIVPIAKGIGSGFPIGACLMTKKIASCMTPGSHGSTFGGNPLAMSVGNAVLDIIFKKGFLKNVQKISKYFHKELHKLQNEYPKVVKEVRGVGLLAGLEISKDQTEFIKKLSDNKLLTVKASENVVRLLPPLTVKKQNIDEAVTILKKVCKAYK
jgi:acetylornithine/N-succinyldiaminopimelate aminotransferase